MESDFHMAKQRLGSRLSIYTRNKKKLKFFEKLKSKTQPNYKIIIIYEKWRNWFLMISRNWQKCYSLNLIRKPLIQSDISRSCNLLSDVASQRSSTIPGFVFLFIHKLIIKKIKSNRWFIIDFKLLLRHISVRTCSFYIRFYRHHHNCVKALSVTGFFITNTNSRNGKFRQTLR